MKKNVQLIGAYCYQHWFKISLLFLIVLGIVKRDFSFSFRFGEVNTNHPKALHPAEKINEIDEKETALSLGENFFALRTNANALDKVEVSTQIAYLKRYAAVVVNERKKCGVPSSLILAVALLQSKAGTSERASKSSNHFNLLCNNNWHGATISDGDLCLRKYESVWMSFRDHSLYITSGKFESLKELSPTDYEAWARQLQKLGYADNAPLFLKEVLDIIAKYKLQRLDAM